MNVNMNDEDMEILNDSHVEVLPTKDENFVYDRGQSGMWRQILDDNLENEGDSDKNLEGVRVMKNTGSFRRILEYE